HGDAVEAGHAHVEEDDVGPLPLDDGEGRFAVGGVADHVDAPAELQQPANSFADQALIVGDDDADHAETGTQMTTETPRPAWLRTSMPPPTRRRRSLMPSMPPPEEMRSAPPPSSTAHSSIRSLERCKVSQRCCARECLAA